MQCSAVIPSLALINAAPHPPHEPGLKEFRMNMKIFRDILLAWMINLLVVHLLFSIM